MSDGTPAVEPPGLPISPGQNDAAPRRALVLVDAPVDWDRRVNFFLDRYKSKGYAVDVLDVTRPLHLKATAGEKTVAALRTFVFWLTQMLPALMKVWPKISALLKEENNPAYRKLPLTTHFKATVKETVQSYYRGSLHRRIARQYSVIHANDLRCLVFAVAAKGSFPSAVVYDSHEMNVFRNRRMSWLRISANAGYEAACIGLPKVVITVCEPIAHSFARLYGRTDVRIVENRFYSSPVAHSSSRAPPGVESTGNPAIIFFGGLGPGRGLHLLGAIARAQGVDCYAVLFGQRGSAGLRQRFGLEAVTIIEHPAGVPLSLPASLGGQRRVFSWCFIEDACLSYRYAMPNKLFQSLELGFPIIAADSVSLGALARDANIGISISAAAAPEEIVGRIRSVTPQDYADMRQSALALAEKYRQNPLELAVDRCIDEAVAAKPERA